jgi:L-asparaginase/Glu-tRNA(Gln) amidotransferase subunit D
LGAGFAGRPFLSGTSFHAVFPHGFQASLSRGIQHKTHSPTGECDRPENSIHFSSHVFSLKINKNSQSVRRTDLGSGVKGMLLAGFGRGQSNETVISFGRETKTQTKVFRNPGRKLFFASFF